MKDEKVANSVEAGDTVGAVGAVPELPEVLPKLKDTPLRRDFEAEAMVILNERGFKLGPKLGKVCCQYRRMCYMF